MALLVVAMVVPATAAATNSIHSAASTESTIVSGSESGVVFQILGGGVKTTCTTTTFNGTMAGSEASSLTLHPVYNEEKSCKTTTSVGTFNAPVKSTGCNLVLSGAPEKASPGSLSVSCEAGHAIEISLGAITECTISIGSQTVSGFYYENQGSWPTNSLLARLQAVEISYTSTPSCAYFGVPSSGSNGYWINNASLSGYANEGGKAGAQTALWVSPPARTFHSESKSTYLRGSAETWSYFSAGPSLLPSCTAASYEGSMPESSASQITVHPEYVCPGAKVSTSGCNLRFSGDYPGAVSGSADIVCEAGKAITVTANACTVSYGSQSGVHAVTYSTSQPGGLKTRSIRVAMKLQGLHWTTPAGCGYYGLGTSGSDGELTSEFTLKGENGVLEQVGVWIE
jgi:hypothetical protein